MKEWRALLETIRDRVTIRVELSRDQNRSMISNILYSIQILGISIF